MKKIYSTSRVSFLKKVRFIFCALLSITTMQIFSQKNAVPASFMQNADIFGTRCFIENKGQFDHDLSSSAKVLFAYDNGDEKIYFTEKGPIYKLLKVEALKEWEMEAIEHGKEIRFNPVETFEVEVEWPGASEKIEIGSTEPTSHYFTYGSSQLNSKGFKKITYKNVYPGIDVEYVFPANNEPGIKYNLVVQPGADVSQFHCAYTGAVKKIKIEKGGNLLVKTPLGDIKEYAPVSYYSTGEKIESSFVLNNNIFSFQFNTEPDHNKTLIVDPWVVPITGLSSNSYAYDVDYDFNGNVYIYGGYNPYKVSQYNNTGVLVWTFAGTVASPAWNSAPIASQASNFAVNKFNSKTYIGQGFVNSGNRVIRLDASGNYDNFQNAPNGQFQEVWDMGFHCTTGDVFVLGGGTSANTSAVTINPTTAVISLATFQPGNNSVSQDVVSHAIDDAGDIFIIYAGGSLSNKICKVNATFNGNVWTQPSSFVVFTEQGNKNQYQWSGSLSSNGFNCLAVNANFLFYFDGLNLAAYNKITGALVANTTVTGLTLKRQGGIAVDDCNNLYLGGNGNIVTYNFNGTTFSAQTPIPLAATTPSTYVYDIKLDKGNKILYVSGSGFVGIYSPVNTLACPTASNGCFFYLPQDFTVCAGGSATIVAVNTASLTNPSYSIQPSGVSNTTGTFIVTPTINTTYTTFITGTNLGNIVITNSAVTTVSVFSQPITAPTTTQSTCTNTVNGFNLGLTWFPSPTTYSVLWSPIPNTITSNTQVASGSGVLAGLYTATVVTSKGCISLTSFSINPAPDPGTFTITPAAPYQLDCINTSVNLNYVPASFNYTTGNLTYQVNGPNVVITSSNSAGTHTIYSQNPNSGCTSSQTFAVTQNTAIPTSTILPLTQNITCSLSSVITVSAYASPTNNVQHLWISPLGGTLVANTGTASYAPGPGINTHCLVDLSNGCQTCKTFTVSTGVGFPTFNVVSPQNFTLGCGTKSVATINIINAQTSPTIGGAVTYTILGPTSASSYSPGALSTFTVTQPGTWTVITRDQTTACETKFPLSVLLNTFPPDINVTVPISVLSCSTPSTLLQGTSVTGNVSYNWSFAGLPGNLASANLPVNANFGAATNSVNGTYTLTILDNGNNCSNSKTVTILQNLFPPKAIMSGGNAISCNTESLVLTNLSTSNVPPALSSGFAVIAYKWEGPTPQEPLLISTTYVAWFPGIYTLTARDENNGCVATATKSVDDNRDYPPLKKPAAAPVVLACGGGFATLIPDLPTQSAYAYSWTPTVPDATTSATDKRTLSVNQLGQYFITVTNTLNGCASSGYVDVVEDTLKADFTVDKRSGFAPLTVTFVNTSHSRDSIVDIKSYWTFGNGTLVTTASRTLSPVRVFTQPGTYSVVMYAVKGNCQDSAMHLISVEIPSQLEVPNIFTPNGDGVNDVFFLHAANLSEVYFQVTDRWGHQIFEVTSKTGNILWDGKNQYGKEVPDGVYLYTLKSTGNDGEIRDLHGNITLLR